MFTYICTYVFKYLSICIATYWVYTCTCTYNYNKYDIWQVLLMSELTQTTRLAWKSNAESFWATAG